MTKIVKDQVEHLIFKYEAWKTLPLLVLSNLELVQIFLFLVRKHVKGAGGGGWKNMNIRKTV